ncbi:MAG: ribbon-helix-helix domain-containing protein [Desulfobacteraceae bacterium]|jgi:metal-responsive CopG/Arc/MetJ family transcriptional regulator|nr:ribbon-helix-helix domain-containing protein [Desulfobacteraceae bacterium]
MPSKKPKLLLVIDEELLQKVDDYRFENRISSRAEAVRQLMKRGLKTSKSKPNLTTDKPNN